MNATPTRTLSFASTCEDPLERQQLEGQQSCRIVKRFGDGGHLDEDRWQEIFERLVSHLIRLEKALSPYVKQLKT